MFEQDICFYLWGDQEAGKYRLRDPNGNPVENTPEETCERIARKLVENEKEEIRENIFNQFKEILGYRFAGGGRIMSNAGSEKYKKETSLINCVVMRQIADSMVGIMEVAKEAAITLKSGCGVGYDFSTIRPKGAFVYGAGAETSGVVSFMKIYDAVCSTVISGGARRGSMMGCLDIQHPEIEEFILAKRIKSTSVDCVNCGKPTPYKEQGILTYFNVSVLITDSFMKAVENDSDWDLWFWQRCDKELDDSVFLIKKDDIPFNYSDKQYFSFAIDHVECVYSKRTPNDVFEKKIFKTIKARYLYDIIMNSTYNYWEPGNLFINKINIENNLYFIETIRATNPCQPGWATIETKDGISIIDSIYIGDYIWSGKRWTKIINKQSSGIQDVYQYVTNAGVFYGTKEHKISSFGKKIEVDSATHIDSIFDGDLDSHKIISKRYISTEEVFNITVDDPDHTYITDGLLVSNCGEQPLSPLSNCLLGSILLCVYIENPFEENASFNYDKYRKDIRISSRLLDNVVEVANLPLKELNDNLIYQRRHGLGFTGLGSMFNMLGVPYGSMVSLEFAEELTKIMAQESLLVSIELAKEKGPAPFCSSTKNRKLWLKSNYIQKLLETFGDRKKEIEEEIIKYGVRWSHATSLAPTGTMSQTWGNNCSSGLEPVLQNIILRNYRIPGKKTKTQREVYDYSYYLWKEVYGETTLPDWWRTTDDLSVNDHLNMQAIIQKWIDSACSKTINVPKNYPFEDFKKIYMDGWKLGLKGVTTYRPNPNVSAGVIMKKEDIENSFYEFTLEDGSKIKVRGDEKIEYDGEEHIACNLFDALNQGIYGNM